MTTFVITIFILNIIGAGLNLGCLAYVEKDKGGAAIRLLANICFGIWAGVLIF